MYLPEGTLTSTEAIEILREQHIDNALITDLELILKSCETARYASGSAQPDDLESKARTVLNALDRIRPLRKGAVS